MARTGDEKRSTGKANALIGKKLRPRKPLGDEVYETLKAAILRGELGPGERLIEEQLADMIGASRTPVRQAIHMLERENLIERRGRSGFVVRILSLEDIEEILDLRSVLESFAARRAAENISLADLELLTRHNETFGQAIKDGDPRRLAALNTEFHDALYKLCRNRRLQRLIHDLHDHFYRYRIMLLSLQEMARTSYQDHKDMIRAMNDRDPDLTERLVRAHILKGKKVVMAEARAGRLN